MARLRLTTLGHTDLTDADGRAVLSVLAQPKRLALLIYLAIEGSRGLVRRDRLVALFWPDRNQADARANLRKSLYFLRKSLGEEAILARGDEEVGIDPSILQCDVVALLEGEDTAAGGIFLDGFHFSGAPAEWDEWLEDVRKRVSVAAVAGSPVAGLPDPGPPATPAPASADAMTGHGPARWLSGTLVTTAALVIAVVIAASLFPDGSSPPSASIARFPSPFLPDQEPRGPMALTSDGSALVYVRPTPTGDRQQLWIRRWENLEASPIPGTEGWQTWFALSPDDEEVAFVTRNADYEVPIKVASLAGGPVRSLGTEAFFVSAWGSDDNVYYFAPPQRGASRISGRGGAGASVSERADGERVHLVRDVLPDGRTGLLEVRPPDDYSWSDNAEIWALDLETGERTFLTDGHTPRYAASGHVLFVRRNTLMAARLDEERRELLGPAVEIQRGLFLEPYGGSALYDVSTSGTLVYMTGEEVAGTHQFVWVDRAGHPTPVDSVHFFRPGIQGAFGWKLSPDGGSIAFQHVGRDSEEIWTKRLPDGPAQRLTFGDAREEAPAWSPDGRHVTYRSRAAGRDSQLWSKAANGSEEPRLLFDGFSVSRGILAPPYGEWLVVSHFASGLWALRPGVDSLPTRIVEASTTDRTNPRRLLGSPAVSPDGRWIAYAVGSGGSASVWVQPFPESRGARWQVSPAGGITPVWAHNGTELFFANELTDELVAVEYEATSAFKVVGRRTLFTIPLDVRMSAGGGFYDVSPDDRRFLMARFAGSVPGPTPHPVVVVQNFFEELRTRVGS